MSRQPVGPGLAQISGLWASTAADPGPHPSDTALLPVTWASGRDSSPRGLWGLGSVVWAQGFICCPALSPAGVVAEQLSDPSPCYCLGPPSQNLICVPNPSHPARAPSPAAVNWAAYGEQRDSGPKEDPGPKEDAEGGRDYPASG